MSAHHDQTQDVSENTTKTLSVVLVCEHASYFMPSQFDGLGLSQADRKSHAAWDPGALAVAKALSERLDAPLVAGQVSRLLYDCNRPPEASDAMPTRSEIIDVPGNHDLSETDRRTRIATFYRPFQATLRNAIAAKSDPTLVTLHSFTPIYHGKPRAVEIGVLHDRDTRLADAMIETAPAHCAQTVTRNQPYGPQDGVTHTLKEHGLKHGLLNVMLEIRSDLIETPDAQQKMGDQIARWLRAALAHLQGPKAPPC